jgi:hypothetical protein
MNAVYTGFLKSLAALVVATVASGSMAAADLKALERPNIFMIVVDDMGYGEMKGKRVILPAASWKEYGNSELPMFYPLFPFNRFALGRDDMQVFRDTYQVGDFSKGNVVVCPPQ